MVTYRVKSLPLKDVISDLAAEFHTTFKEECDLYIVQLPPYVGKGSIKGINFNNGLGLVIYDCSFNDDVRIEFTLDQVHPLKYLYCLEGELTHRFESEEGRAHPLLKYLNIIVASSNSSGHILEFKKQTHTCVNSLEINRERFENEMDCEIKKMNSQLKDTLLDAQGTNQFLFSGDYSLQIAKTFEEIKSFPYEDFLRKAYLHSKAWEILVYQTIQYNKTLNSQSKESLQNLDLVRDAARKIDGDFQQYDTIETLAAELEVSTKHLQRVFKKYNNLTLNKYIMKRRMEYIVDLLENTSYPVSEISELAGIKSVSYLSKIFMETYGMTPSNYRNNNSKITLT